LISAGVALLGAFLMLLLSIAGYATIAALIGGLVMLLLSIAGLLHIRRTPDSATI